MLRNVLIEPNSSSKEKTIFFAYGESIWNYVIAMCIEDHALIGNAGTMDDDSLLGVEMCKKVGLVKVAESRYYFK